LGQPLLAKQNSPDNFLLVNAEKAKGSYEPPVAGEDINVETQESKRSEIFLKWVDGETPP
jgi:hypothetical protein